MRYIGLTNPLPIIVGVTPIYAYYRLVTEAPRIQNLLNGELKEGLLFALLTIILVGGPLVLLMHCKVIIVDNHKITLTYPLRLKTIKYRNQELMSVYKQLNNTDKISFMETHLYFGQERRIKFNSFEILNFKGLTNKLETVDKNSSR